MGLENSTTKVVKMKKKQRELIDMPPIYLKICDRLASDYFIAHGIYLNTQLRIDVKRFPFSLIPSKYYPKEDKILSDVLLGEILNKVLDNDKQLTTLWKKTKIHNLKFKG